VGAGPDRSPLETFITDFLYVLPGHDPAGTGGARVIGHEVRPRLPETEAHAPGIRDLDRRHPVFQGLVSCAPVALERELDVLSRDGITVVKPDAFAEDKLEYEPVTGRAPRLGQTGRHGVARQRLHYGVVQRVKDHPRRDDPLDTL